MRANSFRRKIRFKIVLINSLDYTTMNENIDSNANNTNDNQITNTDNSHKLTINNDDNDDRSTD